MKNLLLTIALVAVVIGLGACGGEESPKSSECEITSFTVSGVTYEINGTSITYKYNKSAPNTWDNLPTWKVTPQIVYSENATIDPQPSVEQNFEESAVTYTVTAEDGTTKKTYTVKADKGTL